MNARPELDIVMQLAQSCFSCLIEDLLRLRLTLLQKVEEVSALQVLRARGNCTH